VVYVKLTDGGGRATVAGDADVAGARSVGLAVGGYHYMQAQPSPETQAEVFAAEPSLSE
jgi:lysozyme